MTKDFPKDVNEGLAWLRFSLSQQAERPEVTDWEALYRFVEKQKIIGVCAPFQHQVEIGHQVLFRWLADVQQIKGYNMLLNKRAIELCRILEDEGFRCCVLKGQGNAEMYPEPSSRMPGDIDVWVDTDEETLQKYVRGRFPDAEECFKHIKFPVFKDVEVDVHLTPLKLRNPWFQKRLQRWIKENKEAQFTHEVMLSGTDVPIHVPTVRFNAVYQLGHIMIHLFDQGVGFRQLVDYYYVLTKAQELSAEERKEIVDMWKRLGMYRLATAVMWVESEILGLPEDALLAFPHASRGRMLLADILEGGNFGQYSQRRKYKKRGRIYLKRVLSVIRLLRISRLFPGESFFCITRRCFAVLCFELKRLVLHFLSGTRKKT